MRHKKLQRMIDTTPDNLLLADPKMLWEIVKASDDRPQFLGTLLASLLGLPEPKNFKSAKEAIFVEIARVRNLEEKIASLQYELAQTKGREI